MLKFPHLLFGFQPILSISSENFATLKAEIQYWNSIFYLRISADKEQNTLG